MSEQRLCVEWKTSEVTEYRTNFTLSELSEILNLTDADIAALERGEVPDGVRDELGERLSDYEESSNEHNYACTDRDIARLVVDSSATVREGNDNDG